MARIRSVKPELRTSDLVASWPFEIRYFWVLLWGYLDDRGRGLDNPKTIAGDCFPHDERITARTIDTWLTVMSRGHGDRPGPVCRYEVAGRRYLHAVNWGEHQKPNRPTPSRLAACPLHDRLTAGLSESPPESPTESPHGNSLQHTPPESVSDSVPGIRSRGAGEVGAGEGGVRQAGNGTTREARQPAPTPPPPTTPEQPKRLRCIAHRHLPDDQDPGPCQGCKQARQAVERYQAEAVEDTRRAIRACRLCDADGRRLATLGVPGDPPCDHRPLPEQRSDPPASSGPRAAVARLRAQALTAPCDHPDHGCGQPPGQPCVDAEGKPLPDHVAAHHTRIDATRKVPA